MHTGVFNDADHECLGVCQNYRSVDRYWSIEYRFRDLPSALSNGGVQGFSMTQNTNIERFATNIDKSFYESKNTDFHFASDRGETWGTACLKMVLCNFHCVPLPVI